MNPHAADTTESPPLFNPKKFDEQARTFDSLADRYNRNSYPSTIGNVYPRTQVESLITTYDRLNSGDIRIGKYVPEQNYLTAIEGSLIPDIEVWEYNQTELANSSMALLYLFATGKVDILTDNYLRHNYGTSLHELRDAKKDPKLSPEENERKLRQKLLSIQVNAIDKYLLRLHEKNSEGLYTPYGIGIGFELEYTDNNYKQHPTRAVEISTEGTYAIAEDLPTAQHNPNDVSLNEREFSTTPGYSARAQIMRLSQLLAISNYKNERLIPDNFHFTTSGVDLSITDTRIMEARVLLDACGILAAPKINDHGEYQIRYETTPKLSKLPNRNGFFYFPFHKYRSPHDLAEISIKPNGNSIKNGVEFRSFNRINELSSPQTFVKQAYFAMQYLQNASLGLSLVQRNYSELLNKKERRLAELYLTHYYDWTELVTRNGGIISPAYKDSFVRIERGSEFYNDYQSTQVGEERNSMLFEYVKTCPFFGYASSVLEVAEKNQSFRADANKLRSNYNHDVQKLLTSEA